MFCYVVSFCIFFFKQKTAYEMRISDWSSDVCSSDLRDSERQYEMHDQRQIVAHGRQRLLRQDPGISLKTQEEMKRRGHDDEIGERRAHREKNRGGQQKRQEGARCIARQDRRASGRASCRDRVWQEVWKWGAAGQ